MDNVSQIKPGQPGQILKKIDSTLKWVWPEPRVAVAVDPNSLAEDSNHIRTIHQQFHQRVLEFVNNSGGDFLMGEPEFSSANMSDTQLSNNPWVSWGDRSLLDYTDDAYPYVRITLERVTGTNGKVWQIIDPKYSMEVVNWPNNGHVSSSGGFRELKHIFEATNFFYRHEWPKGQDMVDLVNAREDRLEDSGCFDDVRVTIMKLDPTAPSGVMWIYKDDGTDFTGD